MTAGTFDPFDLPSAFDPLGDDSLEPTGQSAYSRHGPPPQHRRPFDNEPVTAALPPARPANLRLAHLLPQAATPATAARPSGTACDDAEKAARLATLENEVASLTARLDDLLVVVDHNLEGHRDRLLRAVASLLEQRRGRR